MRNPDPANWGKWSLIPNPELWQAVCLSMDFEPPQRCNLVEFLRLEQNTFNDRMQVCMANIGPPPRPEAARVNLANFAAVVSKWGWPIPQQLQAIAQHAPTPATTAITAPVVADNGQKLPAWLDVTGEYIAGIMNNGQIVSAKVLYQALEAKAGPESPFDKGTGQNRGSLYVRKIAAPVSLKTMQNNWSEIRSLP